MILLLDFLSQGCWKSVLHLSPNFFVVLLIAVWKRHFDKIVSSWARCRVDKRWKEEDNSDEGKFRSERSENLFIPCNPVTASTFTNFFFFNNEFGGGDMLMGEERKKQRERTYPLKNHWSTLWLRLETMQGFGVRVRKRKWRGRKLSWSKNVGVCQRESLCLALT